MNTKIKYLLFLLFIAYFTMNSQNTNLTINSFKLNYTYDFKTNYNFKLTKKIMSNNSFSIYNKQLKTNDYYILKDDEITYLSSKIIPQNNLRIHKIDSFNPNGAADFQEAVLLGILTTIFNN